jgi:hypothetical protein
VNRGRPWQHRRASLNHDWLRNRFILGIGRVAKVVEGKVLDAVLDRHWTLALLDEWHERRAECGWLCDHIEEGMSPANLFAQPPLSGLDAASAEWLRSLSVALWKARWQIDERIARVRAAATALDGAIRAMRDALVALADDVLPRDAAVLLAAHQVRASAFALSEALERLPRGLAG